MNENQSEFETETIRRESRLLRLVAVLHRIPSMYIAGTIIMLIAAMTSLSTSFTQEDAYKYVPPAMLWWLKISLGAITSALVALQGFRSTMFAEHQQRQNQKSKDQTP